MDDDILTTPLALSDFYVRGKTYQEYHLEKRDSFVVVAQICPAFMAAIVDRWQELEGEKQFNLPQTMSEALRLAADQADIINEQAAKIEQDAPKVEFVEKYMESGGLRGFRDAAKSLGFKPKAFADQLKADKFVYYLSGALSATQRYIDQGLFKQVEGLGPNGHDYKQTKITTKGMNYFAQRYATELSE
jgi:phage antirepressor YoqD-like protein